VPFEHPDTYPFFGCLLSDSDGGLWVMAFPPSREPIGTWQVSTTINPPYVEEGGARWRVLDSRGRLVATVRTPARFFPLEVGTDWILGVVQDELEVESVRLYGLQRSRGEA
jgi:hypothetical protein